MGEFVAYNSRPRLALFLLASFAFVAVGLWMGGVFGAPPPSARYPAGEVFVMGWLSVLFFGYCSFAIIKKLFDPSEQLRIGPSGVRYASWSEDTVPWSEIKDVTIWQSRGQKMIVLHLRNRDRFPSRHGVAGKLAAANGKLTGGDVSISLTGTDRSFTDAMTAMERFRRAG